jgi:O-antigen/teichoic acid export membrane protein
MTSTLRDRGSDGAAASPVARGIGLRGRAIAGAYWTVGGQVVQHGLRFVSNLVLTRILVPGDFGLMLAVTALLQGLAMFSDIGLNAAIIQHPKGDEPRFLHTAWTVQVVRGVLLSLACIVLAVPFSMFLEKPVSGLLPLAGLSLLFEGLTSTTLATWNRHLELRRLVLFQTGVQVLATAGTIACALLLRSVHALALGAVLGSLLRMVFSHLAHGGHRCRFAWDRAYLLVLVGFGAWIFCNTLLGFAADQCDRFVFTKYLSEHDAGQYAIAVLIAGMPYLVMVQLAGSVTFPLFGRARDEGRDLADVLSKVKLATLALAGLCVCGLIAAGPSLVELLYSRAYWDAGWMILPVVAGQWFRITCLTPASALFALGRLRWITAANAVRIAGYAVCVPIGWSLAGIGGALAGFAAGEVWGATVYAIASSRHRLGGAGVDVLLTLLAAGAAAAGWFTRAELLELGAGRLVAIAAGVLVGVAPWLLFAPRVVRLVCRRTS